MGIELPWNQPDRETRVPELNEWWIFALGTAAVLLVGVVVVALVALPVRIIARRHRWDPKLIGRVRRPFRALVLIAALTVAVELWLPTPLADWLARIEHGFVILFIAAGAWFLAGAVSVLFSRTLDRYRVDVSDNRVARRVHPRRYAPGMAIKTTTTDADVTEFLDAVPNERRRAEGHAMRALMERLAGEPAVMWGPTMVGVRVEAVYEHDGYGRHVHHGLLAARGRPHDLRRLQRLRPG